MQLSTIVALLATTMVSVNAAPNHRKPKPGKAAPPANACAQNQKQACCNSKFGSALGLQCVLSGVVGDTCDGGSVQCCDVDQNGDINLLNLCVPISI